MGIEPTESLKVVTEMSIYPEPERGWYVVNANKRTRVAGPFVRCWDAREKMIELNEQEHDSN